MFIRARLLHHRYKKNPPFFLVLLSCLAAEMARFMNHEPTDPATPWRGAWSKQWKWQSRSINYSRLIISLSKKKRGTFCCSLWIPCASHPVLVSFCSRLPSLFFFLSLFSLKSWQCFREIKSFLDRIDLYCADELPLSFLELGMIMNVTKLELGSAEDAVPQDSW